MIRSAAPTQTAGAQAPGRRARLRIDGAPAGSLLLLLALWEIAARLAGSRLLPTASAVLAALADEALDGPLLPHLAVTLARVAAAFALAMGLGTALGLALGTWPRLDRVVGSWLTALLNLPALVVIMLLYVWLGLGETAAVLAVAINKLPTTAVTIREGTRALDRDLLEMAESFRIGRWRRLRHVVLPQLAPYLFAAARTGLALIWKIVLVVELLGRSDGVGFQIQIYFQLFDVTRILAYSLAFILVIQAVEAGLLQPWERRTARWRR